MSTGHDQPKSTVAASLLTPGPPARANAWQSASAFASRAMLKIKHVPEQLFDVTVFPVMTTLMFTYLFGVALAGTTGDYLQFLLPGVMVMSIVMITMHSGASLLTDLRTGVFDRFRTLRIWRPAPLVGYLMGDMVRYTAAGITVSLVGLAIGYRPGSILGMLAGIALVVLFAFALSWVWMLFGFIMRSEKSVMGVSLVVLFPITFLSNVFVAPSTMPGWLRAGIEVNPITHLVAAVRSLMDGKPDVGEILWVLVSVVVLITVFGFLTMRQYNRR